MPYILSAFSLNMLTDFPARIEVRELTVAEASRLAEGKQSAVGHRDTAAIFSQELGRSIEENRTTITLARGEEALVGQYRGPRLSEGTTVLPAGATIQWYSITIG